MAAIAVSKMLRAPDVWTLMMRNVIQLSWYM